MKMKCSNSREGIFYGAVLAREWHLFISWWYMRYWFIRWLLESDERRQYKGLPRGCWHCEVLGLCRRPKEEGWGCYNGCMLINFELEEKYRGLPKGCWRCRYLTECRWPKEEGWKCYNGCRVIKEKEEKERKLLEKQEKKNRKKQKKSK